MSSSLVFFFNDTATTEIYTLSLHDALPILALADRGLLPRPQTNSARENLRRHQRQCPEGADLDSTHRHAAAQVSATAQPFPLVAFQPRCPAAPATVCLSRLVALDRPTLPAARDAAACPTSAPAARLNQFGQPMLNL